jgi:linoleoyl-CoA desaturase
VAGVGFNIQHDANHGAFTARRWWNRLTAWSLDLVGGSSYVWRFKHNVLHHQFTNVDGVDDDLEAGPWLRLRPEQPRHWWHRFQHLYMWPLYVFLPLKWQWFDDFYCLITGRLGRQAVPRPRLGSLLGMLAGKALFFGWALVLPLILHPTLPVLLVYAFVCLLMGIVLGTVFQLAHCLEEAAFVPCPAGGARLPQPWAEHQLATTVDFSPRNRVLTWYLGGLNFQVEHHLFPRISHVHYPALESVVRRICDEYGVEHRSHHSVWSALRSHIRHMRRMGTAA